MRPVSMVWMFTGRFVSILAWVAAVKAFAFQQRRGQAVVGLQGKVKHLGVGAVVQLVEVLPLCPTLDVCGGVLRVSGLARAQMPIATAFAAGIEQMRAAAVDA